jgi:hypothetical protein
LKSLASVRDDLLERKFVGWQDHLDFLLLYMQMIRVRSPQFFVEQGQVLAESQIARVTSVNEEARKLTHDGLRPLTEDQVHDFSLIKMREEFSKGSAWMADFHWQMRTTFDPCNPVVASEQQLFAKGVKAQSERAMTMDILTHDESEVWFPLCWQDTLVGRVRNFESDVEPFGQAALNELRHIIAEMSPQYVISPQIVNGPVLKIGQRLKVKRESSAKTALKMFCYSATILGTLFVP